MKRRWIVGSFLLLLVFTLSACGHTFESLSQETEEVLFIEPEEEVFEKKEPEESVSTKISVKTYIRSKVSALNVRAEASIYSARLGTLDKGDMVLCCGQEGDWYKTFYRGREGYVSASSAYSETLEMMTAEERTEAVISEGEKLLGTLYVYGATRLHDGYGNFLAGFTTEAFDCSSYMQYIFYRGSGAVLRSTTRTQVGQGKEVDRSELARGDLIFMTNASRKYRTGVERIGHVALWLGDGYILHTASDHAVIEKMTDARWDNYITARRMIG